LLQVAHLNSEVGPVRNPTLLGLVVVCVLLAFGPAAVAGSYAFTTITPPGSVINGAAINMAFGINDSGTIVGVSTSPTTFDPTTFLYSNGTYSTLSYPGGNGTFGFGINNSGQIVGQYGDASGNLNAFVYTSANNYATINPPQSAPANPYFAEGNTINNKGQVLISALNASGDYDNFLYSNGQYTLLTAISSLGNPVFANGINDAGTIVGYANDSNQVSHGFILKNGQVTSLNDPNAGTTTNFEGVAGTQLNDINNNGAISGFYVDANGNTNGFVYQNGVFTTVDDPLGTNGTYICGINDLGQVVGFYVDSSFNFQAFVATPIPEPSCLSLLAVAATAAAGWRLRKRAGSALL
jgi:probable HAF family extracellular repeat protein